MCSFVECNMLFSRDHTNVAVKSQKCKMRKLTIKSPISDFGFKKAQTSNRLSMTIVQIRFCLDNYFV